MCPRSLTNSHGGEDKKQFLTPAPCGRSSREGAKKREELGPRSHANMREVRLMSFARPGRRPWPVKGASFIAIHDRSFWFHREPVRTCPLIALICTDRGTLRELRHWFLFPAPCGNKNCPRNARKDTERKADPVGRLRRSRSRHKPGFLGKRCFAARSRWSLDRLDESHSPRRTVAAVKGRLVHCHSRPELLVPDGTCKIFFR